ncbi:transcription factor BIM2 [Lactuca sativa]|uniref:transcription factor BIM2 n=1 Tax=Lactuca sativa TaxID=4236 RepID=UPI000CB70F1F|nr:transcription factor BIM2 [Lactuca sativa]
MVRTVKNHHHQEEEEDEEDFISRTTDASSQKDGRRNDQKASSHRSKHSETEQRRRSKINERFQILRDLIPQNDQKRDRASFLLEVIQYIQFLQEKLQVYEGTFHGWSPEPTKLMPWRGNSVTDTFTDQSQPIKNGSLHEGNIVFSPPMLSNTQSLIEHELSHSSAARAAALDIPLQQNTYLPEPDPDPARAARIPHEYWDDRSLMNEDATPNELQELKMQSEGDRDRDRISDAYSKGLLNNLTQALGSCGVDLSQANISVQFDIRKGTSSGSTSTSFGIKEHDFLSDGNQGMEHCGIRRRDDDVVYDQVLKKPRTQQNQ